MFAARSGQANELFFAALLSPLALLIPLVIIPVALPITLAIAFAALLSPFAVIFGTSFNLKTGFFASILGAQLPPVAIFNRLREHVAARRRQIGFQGRATLRSLQSKDGTQAPAHARSASQISVLFDRVYGEGELSVSFDCAAGDPLETLQATARLVGVLAQSCASPGPAVSLEYGPAAASEGEEGAELRISLVDPGRSFLLSFHREGPFLSFELFVQNGTLKAGEVDAVRELYDAANGLAGPEVLSAEDEAARDREPAASLSRILGRPPSGEESEAVRAVLGLRIPEG
eukprot:tig00000555_g2131.t1